MKTTQINKLHRRQYRKDGTIIIYSDEKIYLPYLINNENVYLDEYMVTLAHLYFANYPKHLLNKKINEYKKLCLKNVNNNITTKKKTEDISFDIFSL